MCTADCVLLAGVTASGSIAEGELVCISLWFQDMVKHGECELRCAGCQGMLASLPSWTTKPLSSTLHQQFHLNSSCGAVPHAYLCRRLRCALPCGAVFHAYLCRRLRCALRNWWGDKHVVCILEQSGSCYLLIVAGCSIAHCIGFVECQKQDWIHNFYDLKTS